LWCFETRNILLVNERRGRMSERDTEFFLRALAQRRIRVEPLPEQAGALGIEKLPLATLDRRPGEAARLMGVELFGAGGPGCLTILGVPAEIGHSEDCVPLPYGRGSECWY